MPTLPDGLLMREEIPSVEEYRRLRWNSGLSQKSEEAARLALPNSWASLVVRHDGHAVAMGRVVGDGGCHMQVVDMAVEPRWQGQGIGKAIFAGLVAIIEERAPESVYVSLVADGEAHRLYAQFGFEPVMPASIGMARFFGGPPQRKRD